MDVDAGSTPNIPLLKCLNTRPITICSKSAIAETKKVNIFSHTQKQKSGKTQVVKVMFPQVFVCLLGKGWFPARWVANLVLPQSHPTCPCPPVPFGQVGRDP